MNRPQSIRQLLRAKFRRASGRLLTPWRSGYGARALFSAPAHLALAAGHWRHAYRVRLRNAGAVPVQLLTRHLVFTDTRQGSIVVPYGSPGVVGAAPTLVPGTSAGAASSGTYV